MFDIHDIQKLKLERTIFQQPLQVIVTTNWEDLMSNIVDIAENLASFQRTR